MTFGTNLFLFHVSTVPLAPATLGSFKYLISFFNHFFSTFASESINPITSFFTSFKTRLYAAGGLS